MKNIVIASDSFKGSLSSSEVASAASEGIKEVFPDCNVIQVSIADGGEGTAESLVRALKGELVTVEVCGPRMSPVIAAYGMVDSGTTAVLEMSQASGLTLIGDAMRNPMETTTYGTGQMIMDALRRGCRKFLVGIGGSATNDAGTGMLSAMGFRFLDKDGNVLSGKGADLALIADVDSSGVSPEVLGAEFIIACDVDNPFCGKNGAAYIFAPQKGADAEMVEALDAGLESFAAVTEKVCGRDIRPVKGAGAAGGLGGAFVAYLNARLVPGSDMVLDAVGFDRLIEGADLVITGEGRIDSQTSMGKTPSGVLKRASRQGIPVIAIAGSVNLSDNAGFASVFPVVPGPVTLEAAMKPEAAAENVRRTVSQIMRTIKISRNE